MTRRQGSTDERPVFDVVFSKETGLAEHSLVKHIVERRVQRRKMKLRRLAQQEKALLGRAVEPSHRLAWFEDSRARAQVAWLNFVNAKIRLTIPEAYRVHCDVIEWNSKCSDHKIPDAALGASAITLRLMRWAMASWNRIDFLNRYLAGSLTPRVELDLLPGIACGAHCVLVAERAPASVDDYIAAGRALQRFWLTATSLGLQFQPAYTPLVFARYARENRAFTLNQRATQKAQTTRRLLDVLLGPDVACRAVFMGRIGAGEPAAARSVRLPMDALLLRDSI